MGDLERKRRRHACQVQQWIQRENYAIDAEEAHDPMARSSSDLVPPASHSPVDKGNETDINEDAEDHGDDDAEAHIEDKEFEP